MKKKCVAMLLAGGQGSRLGILTQRVAKPAIPYGGKYRIIDFPLSNCTNSNIDTVGVLTQYQPLELNSYIGSGASWDLDRVFGGVYILPPYVKSKGGEWYKGTANAIYQNMGFIQQFDPEYVLILSGDHIYKMDYNAMIEYHVQKQAAVTIAVLEVPWEEASRFGVMEAEEDGRIVAFEEKPKKPRSNKASMGVYVFSWKELKEYLTKDEMDSKSSKDFGKNVIPAMLDAQEPMFAYPFRGYWKDVGTVESLWQAHMDLLQPRPELDLHDPTWRIYARNPVLPPHFVSEEARLSQALVAEGCTVYGTVDSSVLFAGVRVAEGAQISDSVVMPGASIGRGAKVERAIIAQGARIGAGAHVGGPLTEDAPEGGITVIGQDVVLPPGIVIPAGIMVDQAWLREHAEGGDAQ